MPLFIVVDGERIEIPAKVESDGPDAVAKFIDSQRGKRKTPTAEKE